MRLIILWVVASGAAFAADVDSGDPKAVQKWMAERAKQASAGPAEIVRFPLAHHGTWGSSYPTFYIGTQLESAPGDVCLAPKWARGAEEPDTLDATGRDNGRLAVVEGRFVGTSHKVKQSDDPDEKETYTVWDFEVLRWRPFHDGAVDDTKVKLIATPAQLAEGPVALDDDRPWLATLDSFPVFEKGSEVKASALVDKAKKAGSAKAEVLDSRSMRLLFCCYRVAIAGRFATQDEATAAMKDLKKKGFANAGVRRGW